VIPELSEIHETLLKESQWVSSILLTGIYRVVDKIKKQAGSELLREGLEGPFQEHEQKQLTRLSHSTSMFLRA